jgi:hypothetical protein
MNKLEVKAFGLALGLVWGGITFLLGLLDIFYIWGNSWGKMMAMLYIGYRPTIIGVIVGGIWGFVYASISGFALAWMYNRLVEENRVETEKRIKELAKKIWEKKGKPSGTAQADWREAERIIRGS